MPNRILYKIFDEAKKFGKLKMNNMHYFIYSIIINQKYKYSHLNIETEMISAIKY